MQIANRSDIKGSYISYFSNLVKSHGGINLAQGIPGFDPPTALLDILSGIKEQKSHQYAPGIGNAQLLDQLQQKYKGNYDPERSSFFVVNGATEAISLIYTWLFRQFAGSLNVLAFSPAYESYIHLPRIFGNSVTFLPLKQDGEIDLAEFERALVAEKIKLVFSCSPGNPWGRIIDRKTLDAICSICERRGCYLIIDAVYSELWFSGEKPWYPTGRISKYIFYVNSFSKLYSITGWRVGYFLAHKDNMAELQDIHDYIGLSSPAPLQAALAGFMQDEAANREYVENLRRVIAWNYRRQSLQLIGNGFDIPPHNGGYFIWAQCPDNIASGVDFAIDLYNRMRIAVIPGAHFGKEWERYIRINIALLPEILESGISGICEAVK